MHNNTSHGIARSSTLQLTQMQHMLISDLADGQLQGAAFADAMLLVASHPEAKTAWRQLHILGDELRSPATLSSPAPIAPTREAAFFVTFQSRLAQEPRLRAIDSDVTAGTIAASRQFSHPVVLKLAAANDTFFHWRWVAGLSAAAVAVLLGLVMVGFNPLSSAPPGATLAQSVTAAPVVETASTEGMMLRNPQLDELIAAHSQVGGGIVLQMPSGFLRSATFDVNPNPNPNPHTANR